MKWNQGVTAVTDARIELAKAMGWKQKKHLSEMSAPGKEPEFFIEWQAPDGIGAYSRLKFYPFADANDDFAVLEWMRANPDELKQFMIRTQFAGWRYKIGDYARAACKVLGIKGAPSD